MIINMIYGAQDLVLRRVTKRRFSVSVKLRQARSEWREKAAMAAQWNGKDERQSEP